MSKNEEFKLEFKMNGLRLTSGFHKFKRVKNSVLRKAEETMESKMKEVDKYLEEEKALTDVINDKYSELNNEKRIMDTLQKVLDGINNPKKITDGFMDKMPETAEQYNKASEKYTNLLKEIRKLESDLRDFNKTNKEKMNKVMDGYYLSIANLAQQTLEGINDLEEFADNMQTIDRIIVRDIANIIPMCQAGNSDKKIKAMIQKQLESTTEEKDTSFL